MNYRFVKIIYWLATVIIGTRLNFRNLNNVSEVINFENFNRTANP